MRCLVCLLSSVLGLLFSGCAKREPASAGSSTGAPQILRVSQRNEPASLDPATTILPDEFGTLRTLLEGLLIPGADGGLPLPGAAETFEVSADGLVYTFHLRQGAQWSDGVPVTAVHFLEAYRRLLTPVTAASKASVFFPVKNARTFSAGTLTDFSAVGLRAADDHTFIVTLTQPLSRFPYYVASGPWLPVRADIVARHGRNWTRPENFVGNGPFVLAEWRADQRIVVKKNPRWHGAAGVRLAEIQFVRFDNGDGEERAYRASQIDATMSVPFTKVAIYGRERSAELQRSPLIETRYLSFNTQRPPLNDERVRRALSLAIDRTAIVDRVLQGGQPAAGRLIPAAVRVSGATAPLTAEHRHDPAAARALLASAGLTGKSFPRLELTFWANSAVLEAIQAMWRQELGLDISLALREVRVHLDALATGNYDIGFINAIPDVADAASILGDFATGAPENYPRWSDRNFDAALAAGDLLAAETRLLATAALTPLYFNTKIFLLSPRVRGWQEDGLWSPSFLHVYLDEK